jgi:hypothetical protein
MPTTRVIFTYDEPTGKWEATVEGALNRTDARQAFSAVVLTCQQLLPVLLCLTKVIEQGPDKDVFAITPAAP